MTTTPQIPAEHVQAVRDVFATDLRGLDAVIDYLWAVAVAAGRESAFAGGEVEWSPRYADGSPFLHGTYTEGGARRYADEHPGTLRVFTRRVEPWRPEQDSEAKP